MSATVSKEGKLVASELSWEWMINNTCIKNDHNRFVEVVESPIFKAKTANGKQFEWFLRFYPKGNVGGKFGRSNYASVHLVSSNSERVFVRFRLSIVQNLKVVHEYDSGLKPDVFHYCGWERGERFLKRYSIINEMTGNLKDDNLSIFCYLSDMISESSLMLKKNICEGESTPEQDDILMKLMSDVGFGDVVIEINGKMFRAHRVLLSSHSKVFSKIISKLEEKEEDLISIDDIDDQVFVEILRFIYLGKIVEFEKHAKNLFIAAAKYSMDKLRKMCEKMISDSLTPENAVRHLELADSFELKELRKRIVEFIASNLTAITKTSSFKTMEEMKKGLLFELIQTIATKLESA